MLGHILYIVGVGAGDGGTSGRALGSLWVFFFQAEDGIRDLVRSRGLGDVYKRQAYTGVHVDLRGQGLRGERNLWQMGKESLGIQEHLSLIHI